MTVNLRAMKKNEREKKINDEESIIKWMLLCTENFSLLNNLLKVIPTCWLSWEAEKNVKRLDEEEVPCKDLFICHFCTLLATCFKNNINLDFNSINKFIFYKWGLTGVSRTKWLHIERNFPPYYRASTFYGIFEVWHFLSKSYLNFMNIFC